MCYMHAIVTHKQYHLGYTDDLNYLVPELLRRGSGKYNRVYLVGFSLGANVVVKWLGEQQENAVKLGVCGAAVACTRNSSRKCLLVYSFKLYCTAMVKYLLYRTLCVVICSQHTFCNSVCHVAVYYSTLRNNVSCMIQYLYMQCVHIIHDHIRCSIYASSERSQSEQKLDW